MQPSSVFLTLVQAVNQTVTCVGAQVDGDLRVGLHVGPGWLALNLRPVVPVSPFEQQR